MQPYIILREIAAPTSDLIDLREGTGNDSNLRSQSQPVAASTHQLKSDPVVGDRSLVVENHRQAIDVFDDHVDPSVVVEIPKSRAPAGLWDRHGRTDGIADISERAVLAVQKHKFALAILRACGQRVDLRVDVSVDDEQVRPAVVVEVDASGAPAQVWNRDLPNTGCKGDIGECQVAVVAIKRIALVLEVSHVDREAPSVIEVANGDPHTGHFSAIGTNCRAGDVAHVGKVPLAGIPVEIVGGGIVGAKQSGTAVVVEVAPDDAESVVCRGIVDAGRLRNVGERAISIIAIQAVSQAFHAARATLHRDAAKAASGSDAELWKMIQIEFHVSRNHQVSKAISVVVGKSRAG